MGKKLRLIFRHLREAFGQHLRNASVQLLTPSEKQGPVGGILNEGMLEGIGDVRDDTST